MTVIRMPTAMISVHVSRLSGYADFEMAGQWVRGTKGSWKIADRTLYDRIVEEIAKANDYKKKYRDANSYLRIVLDDGEVRAVEAAINLMRSPEDDLFVTVNELDENQNRSELSRARLGRAL